MGTTQYLLALAHWHKLLTKNAFKVKLQLISNLSVKVAGTICCRIAEDPI